MNLFKMAEFVWVSWEKNRKKNRQKTNKYIQKSSFQKPLGVGLGWEFTKLILHMNVDAISLYKTYAFIIVTYVISFT